MTCRANIQPAPSNHSSSQRRPAPALLEIDISGWFNVDKLAEEQVEGFAQLGLAIERGDDAWRHLFFALREGGMNSFGARSRLASAGASFAGSSPSQMMAT